MDLIELLEGCRPAFGSPGGKRFLAKKIVSYIPDHKTYCEPFIGGGAVFFAKKPSEVEVINDRDLDTIEAFRFIKNLSEEDLIVLNTKKMDGDRKYFEELRDSKLPSSATDKFHRFLYLRQFSFGNTMKTYAPSREGISIYNLSHKIKRLLKLSERLKKTILKAQDYTRVIGSSDGKDSFFYIDPPYPEQQGELKTDLSNKVIFECVSQIMGKFILSLPGTKDAKEIFKKYWIETVETKRTFRRSHEHFDKELLISNFPLKQSTNWLAESTTFTSVLQHHYPEKPDSRLPEHWDIRIDTGEIPFPHIRLYDNPLEIEEEIRIEEVPCEDKAWLTMEGELAPGTPGNPTEGKAFIDIIEKDIPTEVLEDSEDFLRWKFDGKRLKGILIINRKTQMAFWQESGMGWRESPPFPEAVKPYKPIELRDDQLADDWRIFGGWYSTLKRTDKFKYTEDEILNDFTIPVLKEILKRGKQEFHPENWKKWPKQLYLKAFASLITKRRYLVEPHGELIYKNKKKAILASKSYITGNFKILVSDKLAYGFIREDKPQEIDLAEFRKAQDLHRVTDQERLKWWPKEKTLFMFKIREFIPLPKPVPEEPPRGAQTHYDGKPLNIERILKEELGRHQAKVLGKAREIGELGPIVLVPDYVSWTGSNMWVKDRNPNDLDVIVRDKKIPGGSGAWLKIARIAQKFFGMEPHTTPDSQGPNWDYLPQWDLALVPKQDYKIVKVNEPGFAAKFYENVESTDPLAEAGKLNRLLEQLARAASPKIKAQAEKAKKQDKLTLGEFYYVMKPTYAVQPEQRQETKTFLTYFKEPDDFPVLNSKKFDGNNSEVHRKGDKVTVYSEDGTDITKRFPQSIEAFKKITDKDFIVGAEIELWLEGKHQPREAIRGYIGRKDEPDDSNVIFNVYDIVYFDKDDLHGREKIARNSVLLDEFKFPQSTSGVPDLKHRINLVPQIICDNLKELEKSTSDLSHKPASEGVVTTKAKSIYYLDGNSRRGQHKYHKNVIVHGIVIEPIETKVKGVFNYRYALAFEKENIKPEDKVKIKDKEYIETGKTFSTEVKASRGDVIKIEGETFNYIKDLRTGMVAVSVWAPRFLAKTDKSEPDTIASVRRRAKDEEVLQEKTITKAGETLYENEGTGYLSEEEWLLHTYQTWGIEPSEVKEHFETEKSELAKNYKDAESKISEALTVAEYKKLEQLAEKKPKYHAIIERHFRGASAHMDFRVKMDGHLEGWTITDQPKGAITEDVDTLEKGRKYTKEVKWKFNPEMKPEVHVVAVKKAKQPLAWMMLNDKYVGKEAVLEPGTVGATKEKEGVFILEAEGLAIKGVERPYFYEYFLNMPGRLGMKDYKDRMIVRLIGVRPEWEKPPKGKLQWQAKLTKVDVPYILSRRQRTRKDYVPKEGEKAIPPEWEERIKPEFRWWVPGLSKSEKLKRLDGAYNDLIERKILKGRLLKEDALREVKARFVLRRHWWRGQAVIRKLPVSMWDVVIDTSEPTLRGFTDMKANPLFEKEKGVACLKRVIKNTPPGGDSVKDWMTTQHIEVKAGELTDWENPNKDIPAYFDVIDSGEAEWIEDSPNFASFNFKGKQLKGYWIAKREEPKAELWVFSKSSLPGQPKESEDDKIDLNGKDFPVGLDFKDKEYSLIATTENRLRLDRRK